MNTFLSWAGLRSPPVAANATAADAQPMPVSSADAAASAASAAPEPLTPEEAESAAAAVSACDAALAGARARLFALGKERAELLAKLYASIGGNVS